MRWISSSRPNSVRRALAWAMRVPSRLEASTTQADRGDSQLSTTLLGTTPSPALSQPRKCRIVGTAGMTCQALASRRQGILLPVEVLRFALPKTRRRWLGLVPERRCGWVSTMPLGADEGRHTRANAAYDPT